MADVILGRSLLLKLCEALDIPANKTRRIIIDAEVNSICKVYVEMFGGEELLELDLSKIPYEIKTKPAKPDQNE